MESQDKEKEYEQNVWKIYLKELATASPEKKTELNKRMRRWQELMKSGLTASQAYIGVMQEESDTPPMLISAKETAITKTTRYLLLALVFVLVLAISLVISAQNSAPTLEPTPAPTPSPTTPAPTTPALTPSAEEQEYSRIASLSERQIFQQSVKDLRAQGVSINFGRQPPYRGARPQGVRLENNITAVNPTRRQLVDFLKADQTDSHSYLPNTYICAEFAETLHNAAEKAGIRCAFLSIDFVNDTTGHALNAFFTVDSGWIFIDNTGPGLFERLELTLSSSQNMDPFEDWSRDSVAYTSIGRELGFVHISVAKSTDYAFYEDWRSRSQEFEAALDQYNRDVQSYNDWSRGRVFYRGTPEAVRMQSWSNELDARKVALERDALVLGPVFKPMGTVKHVDVYF